MIFPGQVTPVEPPPKANDGPVIPKTDRGKLLSEFDKLCLIQAKYYPNKESIPEIVRWVIVQEVIKSLPFPRNNKVSHSQPLIWHRLILNSKAIARILSIREHDIEVFI